MKFNWDNVVFQGLGKFVDCVGLSLLWLLCCLPVFTIGTSSTALYYTVHKAIRGNRGYVTRTFFGAFRDNFKATVGPFLLWLVIFAVLICDASITYAVLAAGESAGAFFYFFLVMLALALMWGLYLFAYMARFANTARASMKNAALLMIRHLPWSLLMLLALAAALLALWLVPVLFVILPAALALLYDVILERIFRRYMSPEDADSL